MSGTALGMTLTQAGLRATFNAHNNGLEAKISHLALGDANNAIQSPGAHGYAPDVTQTQLHNERMRVAIGDGERVTDTQIHVSALFEEGPEFPIWEAGVFLDDGTLFGIWSDLETPMGYYNSTIPLVAGFDLAIQSIPPNSLGLTINGPSVNITIVGPFAAMASLSLRNTQQIIANDVKRLIPEIQKMWS